MAGADYYRCDQCKSKTFYDASLNYEFDDSDRGYYFPGVGDMRVICEQCVKTHRVVVVTLAEIGDDAGPLESRSDVGTIGGGG